MPTERSIAPSEAVILIYSGWQVWDGQYGPVRVGDDFEAAVEFVQRTPPRPIVEDREPGILHVRANIYMVVADVLDTSGAVVLDLGRFRALRWVRPGEGPGAFVVGTRVTFELSLNVNGWPESPWTSRAAELYGTDHRWRVHDIARLTIGSDRATEITEASMETVDSAEQYCLVGCSVVTGSSTSRLP